MAINIPGNNILKRGFVFLEDGEWKNAEQYFEKVLDEDVGCAYAYLGKLLVDLKLKSIEELNGYKKDFKTNKNYQKIMRFGDQSLKDKIALYADKVESVAKKRVLTVTQKRLKKIGIISGVVIAVVIIVFAVSVKWIIPEYKYRSATELMNNGKYDEAVVAFEELGNYKDSAEKIKETHYNHAKKLYDEKDYMNSVVYFRKAIGYKDSRDYITKILMKNEVIIAGSSRTVGLKADGTVVAVGNNDYGECDVSGWRNIVAVSAGDCYTVGLKSDGSVVTTGLNYHGECDVSGWKDIVAISADGHNTVGLKSDGTVVAVGVNYNGQCNVLDWKDIVAISAGGGYTAGLKLDGTVVTDGYNYDVSDWTDIVAISAGYGHMVGLKADGTVVAVGKNDEGQCDVSGWTDIVGISTAYKQTIGLKADGTVVAVGFNVNGQCDVSDWTDIVAISAGLNHTVGLKSDGTVVAVGSNYDIFNYYTGQCNVYGWKNIKLPEVK